MPKLVILGTANAISDEMHDNTHMAVISENRVVLIDCVNNPITRLKQAAIPFDSLTDMILTHFHPDHVSGVPMLLMSLWLMGRKKPLNIYGLQYTLKRIQGLMDFYDWSHWPNFFPVIFHHLPSKEMLAVLDSEDLRIYTSPVKHLVPTIGLRIESPLSGKTIAYSCDTEPCTEVVRLAGDADVLIHEATGSLMGHSSAAQAGQIAQQSNVKKLYLIHYKTGDFDASALIPEAQNSFGGEVRLAEDLMEISF